MTDHTFELYNIMSYLPELKTSRSVIRSLQKAEIISLLEYYSVQDKYLLQYNHSDHAVRYTLEFLRNSLELFKNIDIQLSGIYIKETYNPITVIGFALRDMHGKNAALSCEIDQNYTNNYILDEAFSSIFQHIFQNLGFSCIEYLCPAGQIGKIRLLERMGMNYEYTIQQFVEDGGYHRVHRKYSLKRDDWMARNNL